MRPLPEHERLHDQLEKHLLRWSGKEPFDQSQLPLLTTTVKEWEQQVQLSLARSPSDQAKVSLHIASDRLNALANAHGETYRQTLADLDGQIDTVMQILNALPTGQDHNRLADELAALKVRAHRTLRDGLPHLSLLERLITTDELGHLGDAVPQLNHAAIVFPFL